MALIQITSAIRRNWHKKFHMCLHVSVLLCNVSFMTDRRSPKNGTAAAIKAAIVSAGTDVPSVEKAAGIPNHNLQAYLNGVRDLPVVDLVRAGGLLSVSPANLIGAVA